jgi:hypothetical protein
MCPNDHNSRALHHICSKLEASALPPASQGVSNEGQAECLQNPANLHCVSSSHAAPGYSWALQGLSQMSIHNNHGIHLKEFAPAERNILDESNDSYSDRDDIAHALDARLSAPRTPVSHVGIVTLNTKDIHWSSYTAHVSHLQTMNQMMPLLGVSLLY